MTPPAAKRRKLNDESAQPIEETHPEYSPSTGITDQFDPRYYLDDECEASEEDIAETELVAPDEELSDEFIDDEIRSESEESLLSPEPFAVFADDGDDEFETTGELYDFFAQIFADPESSGELPLPEPLDDYPDVPVDPSDRRVISDLGYILHSLYVPKRCNVIKAQMGSGKTEAAKQFVNRIRRTGLKESEELRVLIVVPRKSLATELAKEFKCVDYQVVHPRDFKGDTSYVVCINSLPLIASHINKFNMVILDELSGTIGNIYSSLMRFDLRGTAQANLHHLMNPAKYDRNLSPSGKTVLIMDASMSERELSFIRSAVDCSLYYRRSYYRPPSITPLPQVTFEPCIFNFLRELAIDLLCSNKKIALATCAKQYAGILLKLFSICSEEFLASLRIDTSTIIRPRPKFCYFDAETSKEKIHAHLQNQELFKQYDIFIYSPVFVSGISITVEHFDKLFAIAQYGTLNSNDFVQMLARIRKLKDNVITIGCSGKGVCLPPSKLNLEFVAETISDLNSQTEEFQDSVLASLGIEKKFFRVRKDYSNKDQYRAAIDDYFKSDVPQYQKDVMCHTVLSHLKTRSSMFDSIAESMRLNHPDWNLRLSLKQNNASMDFGKDALSAILVSHVTELGDIKSINTEDFLVIDPTTFEEKCKKFSILGNSNSSEDYQFRDDMIQSAFSCLVPAYMNNFLMYFSPFSFWYSLVVTYCSFGDNRSFADEMLSIQMYTDLFIAMGWNDHFVTLFTPSGANSFCVFDVTKLHSLKLTTHEILRHWKPLTEWGEKYRLPLALMGVTSFGITESALLYRHATRAKDCIVKLLMKCGISFEDKSYYMTSRNGKTRRIRRKTVATMYGEMENICGEDLRLNLPEDAAQNKTDFPCYQFEIDQDKLWQTIDVSLRRGFNLHFGGAIEDVLTDDMHAVGVIYENSRQNILNHIPPSVKDVFLDVFKYLYPFSVEMRDVPSFWVLKDEKQRDKSLNTVRRCYHEFSESIKDTAITMFIELANGFNDTIMVQPEIQTCSMEHR